MNSAEETKPLSLPDFFAAAIEGLAPAPWCENLTYASVRHVDRNCDIDCTEHTTEPWCNTFARYDGTAIAQIRNRADEILAALRRDQAARNAELFIVVSRNEEIVEDCEVFASFDAACTYSDRVGPSALVYPKRLDAKLEDDRTERA